MSPPLEPASRQDSAPLALWEALAASLEQATRALTDGDLDAFERATERQQQLCDQLRGVLPPWPGRGVCRDTPEGAADQRECMEIERRVKHLNRVYAALLRRANRSLETFCRMLDAAPSTYAAPMRA